MSKNIPDFDKEWKKALKTAKGRKKKYVDDSLDRIADAAFSLMDNYATTEDYQRKYKGVRKTPEVELALMNDMIAYSEERFRLGFDFYDLNCWGDKNEEVKDSLAEAFGHQLRIEHAGYFLEDYVKRQCKGYVPADLPELDTRLREIISGFADLLGIRHKDALLDQMGSEYVNDKFDELTAD